MWRNYRTDDITTAYQPLTHPHANNLGALHFRFQLTFAIKSAQLDMDEWINWNALHKLTY